MSSQLFISTTSKKGAYGKKIRGFHALEPRNHGSPITHPSNCIHDDSPGGSTYPPKGSRCQQTDGWTLKKMAGIWGLEAFPAGPTMGDFWGVQFKKSVVWRCLFKIRVPQYQSKSAHWIQRSFWEQKHDFTVVMYQQFRETTIVNGRLDLHGVPFMYPLEVNGHRTSPGNSLWAFCDG